MEELVLHFFSEIIIHSAPFFDVVEEGQDLHIGVSKRFVSQLLVILQIEGIHDVVFDALACSLEPFVVLVRYRGPPMTSARIPCSLAQPKPGILVTMPALADSCTSRSRFGRFGLP